MSDMDKLAEKLMAQMNEHMVKNNTGPECVIHEKVVLPIPSCLNDLLELMAQKYNTSKANVIMRCMITQMHRDIIVSRMLGDIHDD